jgi:hypothetical protein
MVIAEKIITIIKCWVILLVITYQVILMMVLVQTMHFGIAPHLTDWVGQWFHQIVIVIVRDGAIVMHLTQQRYSILVMLSSLVELKVW